MKKGFIFVETMVVIAFLGTVLLTVYSSFITVIDNAKTRLYYDDPVYVYRTYYLLSFLEENGLTDYIKAKFSTGTTGGSGTTYIAEFGCDGSQSVLVGENEATSEANFCAKVLDKWDINHIFIMPYKIDNLINCINNENLDYYCTKNRALQNLSVSAVNYLYTLDGYTGTDNETNLTTHFRIVVEFQKKENEIEYEWYEYNDINNIDVCKSGPKHDTNKCNSCRADPSLDFCKNTTSIATYRNYYTTLEIPFGLNDEREVAADMNKPIIGTYDAVLKDTYLSDTYRDKIKTITLSNTINVPNNAVVRWDLSTYQNNKVMGYLMINASDSTKYDLYIQGDGGLMANRDSSKLFYNMPNLTNINNLTLLDTKETIDMTRMFAASSKLTTIDLTRFNTDKLTNMRAMFGGFDADGNQVNMSLTNIIGLNNLNTSNVESMNGLFSNNHAMTTINISNWNTSNVKDMAGMFNNSNDLSGALTTITFGTNFKTNQVVDMSYMFADNPNLTNVDLSRFDTSNVTNMSYMFCNAKAITSLNFNNFNTKKVITMERMFYHNDNLNTLNLNSFETDALTNVKELFAYSASLKDLHINKMTFNGITADSSNTFKDMKNDICIRVKSPTERSWVLSTTNRPSSWGEQTHVTINSVCG